MKTEKTPQQQAIDNTVANLKKFLAKAKRRDGKTFTVVSIDHDANGMPVTISGLVEDEKKSPIDMVWNTQGKALNQNVGFDLVVKIDVKDFLKG